MKVLQLGRFYPPSVGGTQTAIRNIREGLVARGVECDVLCCGDTFSSVTERADGGAIYRAGSFGVFLSTSLSPAIVLTLRKIASRYDVIQIHHPDPMATLALFLADTKAKIIVHWHSDIVRQKLGLKLFAPLQTWLLNTAAHIIVTTPMYARSRFLQAVRNKIAVIPLGIETDPPPPDSQIAQRIGSRHAGKFLVFALGRAVYYKGFEYLIKAASQLDEHTHIVIGGSGPLLDELRNLAKRLGLSKRVFLPGALSSREVAAYYAACDVFCLSSTHASEAFGIVQLEAMKFGKPIIATTIAGSGVSWVNANMVSGVNVAPCSPDALATAIKALAATPSLRKRLGRQGRRRLQDLFSRERMCVKMHEMYLR